MILGVYISVQLGLGFLQLENKGPFRGDPKLAVSGMSPKIIVLPTLNMTEPIGLCWLSHFTHLQQSPNQRPFL